MERDSTNIIIAFTGITYEEFKKFVTKKGIKVDESEYTLPNKVYIEVLTESYHWIIDRYCMAGKRDNSNEDDYITFNYFVIQRYHIINIKKGKYDISFLSIL